MCITFYCGYAYRTWNHHPPEPGPFACIAPRYGRTHRTRANVRINVPPHTRVIQDSGAFSDDPLARLTYTAALKRQEKHATTYHYQDQITHRASYDLLLDEKWIEGSRHKVRWSESDAWESVEETILAAHFLSRSEHRNGLGVILSAQGVTPHQYLYCTQKIVLSLRAGDIFGLGGWCIIGKSPAVMMPAFRETMDLVVPFLGREGIRRVHIWGVCHAPALAYLLRLCDQWGIDLSTDSASPALRPAFGRWGYLDWTRLDYKVAPILESCRNGNFEQCSGCRGLERALHVRLVRGWLLSFCTTRFYRELVTSSQAPAHHQAVQRPLWSCSAWGEERAAP